MGGATVVGAVHRPQRPSEDNKPGVHLDLVERYRKAAEGILNQIIHHALEQRGPEGPRSKSPRIEQGGSVEPSLQARLAWSEWNQGHLWIRSTDVVD